MSPQPETWTGGESGTSDQSTFSAKPKWITSDFLTKNKFFWKFISFQISNLKIIFAPETHVSQDFASPLIYDVLEFTYECSMFRSSYDKITWATDF